MKSKRELSFSCATNAGNPERARYSHLDRSENHSGPVYVKKSGSSSVQAVPISASVFREKRWPFCRYFCPSQQHSRMLWLCHLDWVDLAGQAKVFIGEKLTRLVGAAKRLSCDPGFPSFEDRDLGLKVCRLGRLNAKNNPRDYGIEEHYWKPSSLSKTYRYCWRALVHFHFPPSPSFFFHLQTGLQNSRLFLFVSKSVFKTRRAGLRYSRAGDLECLSLMPDSTDLHRSVWNRRHETETYKVTRQKKSLNE